MLWGSDPKEVPDLKNIIRDRPFFHQPDELFQEGHLRDATSSYFLAYFVWMAEVMSRGINEIVRLDSFGFEVLPYRQRNASSLGLGDIYLLKKNMMPLKNGAYLFIMGICSIHIPFPFYITFKHWWYVEETSLLGWIQGSPTNRWYAVRAALIRPIVESRFTNPKVCVKLPPNPDTSIGCL